MARQQIVINADRILGSKAGLLTGATATDRGTTAKVQGKPQADRGSAAKVQGKPQADRATAAKVIVKPGSPAAKD